MICPVTEGKRSAIPLGVKPVYSTSDGEGGKGAELAHGIYDDLKAHAGLSFASPRKSHRWEKHKCTLSYGY